MTIGSGGDIVSLSDDRLANICVQFYRNRQAYTAAEYLP